MYEVAPDEQRDLNIRITSDYKSSHELNNIMHIAMFNIPHQTFVILSLFSFAAISVYMTNQSGIEFDHLVSLGSNDNFPLKNGTTFEFWPNIRFFRI